MSENFSADMGFLWAQTDPNTEPLPLGCHDVADIAQPQGAVTLRYCPDPSGPGKWEVAQRRQGPPAEVTTTVTTYFGKVADWLQKIKCFAALYVHQSTCGARNLFGNYDAGNQLYEPFFTNKSKSNLAMRETNDASEQSFDLSAAPPLQEYWKLSLTSLVTASVIGFNDIAICGEDLCWGACGPSSEACDDLCVGAGIGADNVECTSDGGATWTATALDPFLITESVASLVCFPVDRGVIRRLAACGVTKVAGGPEVSYSDDDGATWTGVTVDALAVGAIFVAGGALWAVDMYHIWGVTDDGAIYFSSDGGVSWTEQATANVAILHHIHFCDEYNGLAVGATNAILSTKDGGAHWTIETGPAAQAAVTAGSCTILDPYRWWVGYDDGTLWFTNDAGTTWTQRVLAMPAGAASVDAINDQSWFNHFHGCLAVDYTAGANNMGAIYRTVNGGYDWEIIAIPTAFDAADTINSVVMCDPNKIYAVGGLENALGTIFTAQPSP